MMPLAGRFRLEVKTTLSTMLVFSQVRCSEEVCSLGH